jgi:AsmA protein
MKTALKIAAIVLLLVVAAVLLLPPFIDLGRYKDRYLPLVEEALQRKVDVGEVRLRILPAPAIRISRVNVSDDPAFSHKTFFSAEQASLRLRLGPLFRGRFQIDEFTLERPVVNLVQRRDGTFNFASLGKGAKEKERKKAPGPEKDSEGRPARLAELVPSRIRLEDGAVVFQNREGKTFQLHDVDLSLEGFSPGRLFSYRVAVGLPEVKPIVLEGLATYSESEASLTLKESRLNVQGVDFTVNGAITRLDQAPAVSLTLANGAFEMKPIAQLLSQAGAFPKRLELAGPVGLEVSLRGPFDRMISSVNLELRTLQANDPEAFKGLLTGKIKAIASLNGKVPVSQSLQGNGTMAAKDGELTNVDLLSRIRLITGLIGIPDDQSRGATTFKSLESDFTLGGGMAQFQRLWLVNPLLEARGRGNMTLASPSLDLSIEVALSPEVSARAGGGQAATFFKDDKGRIVVPLRIRGPANKPSVDLDKEALVRKGVGRFLERGKGEILERLFKRN